MNTNNIDIIGTENVLKYIEATGLKKFCIQRADANGSFLPVFECYDSESNETALVKFKGWAEFTNPSRPYKISLFNFIEFEQLASGETKAKKSSHKGNKTEASFVLSNVSAQNSLATPQQNFSGDFSSLKAEIVREISKQHEENAILAEIKNLSARLDALDSEEEEEEEEEESAGFAGLKGDQLQQLMGLMQLFKKPQGSNAINGVKISQEQIANCNNAIKRLFKSTPDLDTHLLKLAEVSEQKPELFKMLLENLKTL